MSKIISYMMNSAWRTNDKWFMFPHEACQVASIEECGGLCRFHLFGHNDL